MDIKFFIPAESMELKKSEDNESVLGKIRGIASTPDIDFEGEKVIQEGLDIKHFLEKGFFNWDHDNSQIVGYPDKDHTKITKDGFYVEGFLLNTPLGKRVWDTSIALEKSGSNRSLGFSIEGQILKQDKKGRIEKARVTNVAITSTPVNSYTSFNTVAKSMISTSNASSLIKESLDGVMRYAQRGIDGDIEVLDSLNSLKSRLNTSQDDEDKRLYLMLFKGLYGADLEDTMKKLKEI